MNQQLNPSYIPILESHHRYLLLYGGAGSGKSHFAAQKILWRLMNEPNHRFVLCRKVARTIHNSQYRLLKDLVNENGWTDQFSFCDDRMDITHKASGNLIISTGVDDPEKLKSLAGPTGIWIEEATELTPKDFHQLDLRLRAVTHTYIQTIATFNPVSRTHWLYEMFMAGHKQGACMFRTSLKDNNFMDAQYQTVMDGLRTEDPDYYQVYGLGQWGQRSKGLIYNYELIDEMPQVDSFIYGLDFGFNNPTVLVKVGIRGRDLYIEEVIYRNQTINSDLIPMLKRLVPDRRVEIYADCSEPSRIEEIYRAGFNVHAAQKDVQDGIDHVKSFRLHVVKGSMNIIRELDSYSWKQDRNGLYIDAPDKYNDHACDAFRYAVHTHFTRRRAKVLGFL